MKVLLLTNDVNHMSVIHGYNTAKSIVDLFEEDDLHVSLTCCLSLLYRFGSRTGLYTHLFREFSILA
jgi:hypothetical protein